MNVNDIKPKVDTGRGRPASRVDWKNVSKSVFPSKPPFYVPKSPASSRAPEPSLAGGTLFEPSTSSRTGTKNPLESEDGDLILKILQVLHRQIKDKEE